MRETSYTLADVMRMTAREYAGWVKHFEKYPPGDIYVQRLIAELSAATQSYFAQQLVTPSQIAPWMAHVWDSKSSGLPDDDQARKTVAGLVARL